jgi:hypothetical protein
MVAVWEPCSALWVVSASFYRLNRLGNPSRSRGRTTQNSLSRPLQTSLLLLYISLTLTTLGICNGPTPEDTMRQATATAAFARAEVHVVSSSEDPILPGCDTASLDNRRRNVEKYFPVMRSNIQKNGMLVCPCNNFVYQSV